MAPPQESGLFHFYIINIIEIILTLRRPNFLGVHVPVTPDLAKTVKGKSDHSENLARVLGGAKNGKII